MQKSEDAILYEEQDKVYHSDTCLPLISAWKSQRLKFNAYARLGYPGTYRMEKEVLPGLSTVGYWDANSDQDWGLGWHRNEGIEISFLETGSISFSSGNEQYQIMPGELTITRPWQPHKLGDPTIGIGKLFWIILDVEVRHPHQEWQWPSWIMLTPKDLNALTKMMRQNEQPLWRGSPEIKKCFQKIGQLVSLPEKHEQNESWMIIYINELLMHMLELFRFGSFTYDESLINSSRSVKLFIDQLNDTIAEPWTLETMAQMCGLGTTRFIHYFGQLMNMTPMQYLNNIRLKIAADQLITRRDISITQICYNCGFSNSQYFATVFQKHYGLTPSAYRSHHNNYHSLPPIRD